MPSPATSTKAATSVVIPPATRQALDLLTAGDDPKRKADTELRLCMLKLLYNVGSNGMMQKHLFTRAPKSSTARKINALASLADGVFVKRSTSDRHTEGWGYLWTITTEGRAAYLRALATTPAGIPATR